MRIGVTGGTGAGKTTVCSLYERLGAARVDADRVGHETLEVPKVRDELVAAFGPEVVDENGRIVRRELGRRAFASDAGRETLNRIVWPPLDRLLQEKVRGLLAENPDRPVVVDAALILEFGSPERLCDVLVVVTADRETRKRRTMERLGIDAEQAEARMAAQLPDEEKVAAADYVIRNDGTQADLERKAGEVWEAITGKAISD